MPNIGDSVSGRLVGFLQLMNLLLPKLRYLVLLIVSTCVVVMLFYWEGHVRFDLADEGFLWYGTQRVMAGEIPILDFMAYDPGRYYWSAIHMGILSDDGILALRASIATFSVLGLFLALVLLTQGRTKPDYFVVFLALMTIAIWMFPRHKLYDITISITLVAALSFLLKQSSCKRYFLMGLTTGLAAVFGRNHGLYGVIGTLCAMMFMFLWHRANKATGLARDTSIHRLFLWWVAGITTGYAPVLILLITNQEFAVAFMNSIRTLFEQKSTNLTLPVPWPWLVDLQKGSVWQGLKNILVGSLFVGLPMYICFGIFYAFVNRKKESIQLSPVVLASVCMAIPYAHFAFSRADIQHLAQGIFPVLIGVFALLSVPKSKVRIAFAGLVCIISFFIMLGYHPGWQAAKSGNWAVKNIGEDLLKLRPKTIITLDLLDRLENEYASNGQSFVATPTWPGAYALFHRKSLTWEIFALFPRSTSFQNEEIERIKNGQPGFVLIEDRMLDGRDDLRFKNTHSLIEEYIMTNFHRLDDAKINPRFHVYVRK